MSIPRGLRNKVAAREDFCCSRCGKWADGGSLHHRKLRSQGGRNDLPTLILMCGSGVTGCHGWAHHQRTDAAREGYIVKPWQDPAGVPVKVYGHGWVRLTADGRYVPSRAPLDPTEAAA